MLGKQTSKRKQTSKERQRIGRITSSGINKKPPPDPIEGLELLHQRIIIDTRGIHCRYVGLILPNPYSRAGWAICPLVRSRLVWTPGAQKLKFTHQSSFRDIAKMWDWVQRQSVRWQDDIRYTIFNSLVRYSLWPLTFLFLLVRGWHTFGGYASRPREVVFQILLCVLFSFSSPENVYLFIGSKVLAGVLGVGIFIDLLCVFRFFR